MFVSLLPPVCGEALSLVSSGLLHESFLLRNTVLQSLLAISPSALPASPQLKAGILIVQHDEEEANRELALR